MLLKITDFFKLFIEEDYSSLGSVGTLLFLYGNIILYLLDFYRLVKRKSQAENIAIMSVPVLVSACGTAMAMIFVHMPGFEHLEKFAVALHDQDLRFGLGTLVVIYAAIWLVTYLSQQKRKREDVRNWIVSCVPDYCFVVIILLGTVFPWFVKIDLILWLYLYGIYLLACKAILLIIGNITRFYSLKITRIRWNKGKSPHAFLTRYFFLYQNSVARNVLVVLIGILFFLTISLSDAGWPGDTINIMIYLYLGTLLPMALTGLPTKNGLNRLAAWGDRTTMERLFCQEYFVEEPLYQDHNFTVTKHFLIEEQSPVLFYYLPNLERVSGWIINESGRYKIISFADGMQCRITSEEAEQSEQMLQYLQKKQIYNSDSFNNAVREKQSSYAERKCMEAEAVERAKRKRQIKFGGVIVLIAGIISIGSYLDYRGSDAYAYKECLKSGQKNFQEGYYRNAMEDFEDALILMPESEEAEDGYFYSLLGLARETAAISNTSTTLYDMLLQQRPQESYLYGEMAQLYLMQKDYLGMLSILERGYEETADFVL